MPISKFGALASPAGRGEHSISAWFNTAGDLTKQLFVLKQIRSPHRRFESVLAHKKFPAPFSSPEEPEDVPLPLPIAPAPSKPFLQFKYPLVLTQKLTLGVC